jgi:hypothetical protein
MIETLVAVILAASLGSEPSACGDLTRDRSLAEGMALVRVFEGDAASQEVAPALVETERRARENRWSNLPRDAQPMLEVVEVNQPFDVAGQAMEKGMRLNMAKIGVTLCTQRDDLSDAMLVSHEGAFYLLPLDGEKN